MSGKYTIGIDLGGTNIKAGVLDEQGELVYRCSNETQADRGFEHAFSRLVLTVDQCIAESKLTKRDILAIGYGTPGPMSHKKGIIYASPNLPGWVNIPMRAKFSEAVGLPVTLENDANVAAYGEFIAGAGKGTQDMVMLTLGTGIGGGVVLNGRMQRGAFDNAGEIGHVIAVPNGRACPCGQLGCLERYGSANSVAERLAEALQAGNLPAAEAESVLKDRVAAGESITSADVAKAAREGDALASRIWDETCMHIGIACVNVQHMLNPELIVIGGGLIRAGAQLLDPIRTHFEKQSWRIAKDQPQIEFATRGDDAGVIGAAALARDEFGGE